MSGFSEAWLRLREPADAASRSRELVAMLGDVVSQGPIDVVDLGTGLAANLRYQAPLLGGEQRWLLIDHDRALLAAIPDLLNEWARDCGAAAHDHGAPLRVEAPGFTLAARCACNDLAVEFAGIGVSAGSVVTAAALLDLVSDSWLAALVSRCVSLHAFVLFALTYDGRIDFDPPEPEDMLITELVNRHQRTDKGFGPALGPTAASRTVGLLEQRGYHVETARSDWRLGPGGRQLQKALIENWVTAALEIEPEQTDVVARWVERRREHIAAGRSSMVVGHVDLLGRPIR